MERSGDRRARFEAVFQATYEPVLAYSLRRARVEVAEDIVAETFVVAWRRFDEIPSDPLPWLLGVARKVLANQRRSGERGEALISRLTNQARHDLIGTPDLGVEVEERRTMTQALERLTDQDRELLMLVAWEGLSNERAAEVLGVTTEVFAVRLHRARKRLEKEIAKLEGRPPADGDGVPA